MRIAVTGANGFLGRGVVKALLDKGVDVVAFDRACNNVDSRATLITGDLFSLDNPYAELGEPDCVLHMAWRDGFVHNAMTHIQDFPKHAELLGSLLSSNLKMLAVMGSMHEVGYFEGGIRHNTPCNPQTNYGIAKNALRQFCFSQCVGNETSLLWLRGFYIVDHSSNGSSVFSKIYRASEEGKRSFPFTYGQNQYDFLDYHEFCEKVATSLLDGRNTGIYNIASGRPEKLADRVERFIKENELDIELQYGAFPDRPYDSPAVWGFVPSERRDF